MLKKSLINVLNSFKKRIRRKKKKKSRNLLFQYICLDIDIDKNVNIIDEDSEQEEISDESEITLTRNELTVDSLGNINKKSSVISNPETIEKGS